MINEGVYYHQISGAATGCLSWSYRIRESFLEVSFKLSLKQKQELLNEAGLCMGPKKGPVGRLYYRKNMPVCRLR